jgi:SAM-dependent methyltransferase
MPAEVEEQVAAAIVRLARAEPGTRFVEPGIGTGRIALPLLRRGHSVAGVDTSPGMLGGLRRKLGEVPGRAWLVRADATQLPFASGSFDAALTVHLLHLIPAWQAALGEIRRVLKPDGVFLSGDERWARHNPLQEFDRQWWTLLAGHGVRLERRGGLLSEVFAALREEGARLEEQIAAEWRGETTVGAVLDHYAKRTYSSTWHVPDTVYPAAVRDLRAWATHAYGPDDAPLVFGKRFELTVARGWAGG